ncbi:MAG: hypothetical protein R3A79_18130 [Nannocystaceae bacterium]
MRTSLFAAPVALALALAPLACAEDEEPEVLHEPGITYESEEGTYTFELEAASWPLYGDFPFAIGVHFGPLPLPKPPVSVDFKELKRWPNFDVANAAPEVTPDPGGGTSYQLNYTFTDVDQAPGIWMQEVELADMDGNVDTCVIYFKIRDRP